MFLFWVRWTEEGEYRRRPLFRSARPRLPPTNRRVVRPVTWQDQPINAVIQLLFKLGGRIPDLGPELCVQCGFSVQVPDMLAEIGVPSIISQKTRNIGSKLISYWPTFKTSGLMRPICASRWCFVDGQIELSRQSEQWSGRPITPRSNLIMLCELTQDGLISENAQ